jgi:hypothetical protein
VYIFSSQKFLAAVFGLAADFNQQPKLTISSQTHNQQPKTEPTRGR